MSKLQSIVQFAISDWFRGQQIEVNIRPPWMHGLELDFFLPALSLAIEVQGRQHYQPDPNLEYDFKHERQRQRDREKKDLCRARNIKLLYVLQDNPRALQHLFKALKHLGFRPLPPSKSSNAAKIFSHHSSFLKQHPQKFAPSSG